VLALGAYCFGPANGLSENARIKAMAMRTIVSLLMVPSLFVTSASPASTQEPIKTCSGIAVRSIDVSYGRGVYNLPVKTRQGTIETSISAAEPKVTTVVARGPILGSMDAFVAAPDLACTKDGFVLTVTTSRSVNYHGFVMQNILWRPVITLRVRLDSPKVVFQSIWKMELSDGTNVDRARTPPYPEEKYPIVVTNTLHATSDHK